MLGVLGLFLQAAAGHILYLALHLESSSFPQPLSAAQQQAAFAALRTGDSTARETLICHNLRLVAHVAKKYYAATDEQDDLVSIGTIGLMKAVDSYDPTREVRFSSYASQCIENEIRMHLRRVRRQGSPVSLQEPLEGSAGDGGALTLGDTLPDDSCMEQDYERQDLQRHLRTILETLPAQDYRLLALRYGLDGQPPQTQQQVAEQLGISRSYVSRLEKRVLQSLRRSLR